MDTCHLGGLHAKLDSILLAIVETVVEELKIADRCLL